MNLPDPELINHENITICINIVKEDGKLSFVFFEKTKDNDKYIWKEKKGCQIILKETEKLNQQKFIEFINSIK